MNRREILKATGLALSSTALVPISSLSASGSVTHSPAAADKKMPNRRLGTLQVSSIGLGVQNMHRHHNTSIPTRSEMVKIINEAYESGVSFFDTAEAYGPFECEKILGESVSGFRNNIVIASKFGWNVDQATGKRLPGLNSKPAHMRIVVEGMLKRLKTDRIDLLYQHRVDPEVPIEDVVGTIKDLITEGKVLHYGLSEPGVKTIRRAHKEHPITAIQNEYSLVWRGPEKNVLPLCEELGIGFVCWCPLGCGFLTGAIDENTRFAPGDIRAVETRYSPENLPTNMALIQLIKKWGAVKNATIAQISLAWLLAQKPWVVPIPGTTQMPHMKENIGAANIQFSASEWKEFSQELSKIPIVGERLPATIQAYSDVEAPEKK
jgi:aryl-alcohol dehydrogenase-like predicted oxidoreductase